MPEVPDAIEAVLRALHAIKDLAVQAEDRLLEMVVGEPEEQPKGESDA